MRRKKLVNNGTLKPPMASIFWCNAVRSSQGSFDIYQSERTSWRPDWPVSYFEADRHCVWSASNLVWLPVDHDSCHVGGVYHRFIRLGTFDTLITTRCYLISFTLLNLNLNRHAAEKWRSAKRTLPITKSDNVWFAREIWFCFEYV